MKYKSRSRAVSSRAVLQKANLFFPRIKPVWTTTAAQESAKGCLSHQEEGHVAGPANPRPKFARSLIPT
jgi:hypothetical protein